MDSEKHKTKHKIKHKLSPKIFKERNSLLTDLLEDVHIRTIYNLAWVVVVTSQLRYFLDNYFTNGRFGFNLELFKISFSKPHLVLHIWIYIFLAALLPYFGFILWATVRKKTSKLSVSFFDQLSLIIFISYLITYTHYFASLIHKNNFKPAAGAALMLELVRLKMKFYAFVRSNVPRVIKFTCHDKDEILYPNISQYIYFLFAPTLVYQDEYPRSKSIRWKKVAEHFGNFAGTLLLMNMIIDPCMTRFEIFSRNPFTWTRFIVLVVEIAPLSGMILITMSYLFFHCWSNAFAEMLRFSDRSFYKDFWTCREFERYYRTWNGIVHDWLYVYVYKDFYEIVWARNIVVAKFMVFLLSALYHELIVGIALNMFLFYLFMGFFSLSFIIKAFDFNHAIGNFYFLLCSGLGSSILVCGYATQYYYRKIM